MEEQKTFSSEQYSMFEEDGGTQRGRSARSGMTDSTLSTVSEGGRVIDGRYTVNGDDDYVSVEVRNTHLLNARRGRPSCFSL